MRASLEEIKNRLNIVEYIQTVVPLKKVGRNFKGICPFHQEKTPSFIVSPDRQLWHCFGACQEGGDIIQFVMKLENCTFFEAVRELAKKTGVPIELNPGEDAEWKQKEKFITANVRAKEFFKHVLHHTSFGQRALSYLEKRGIRPAIMDTFELGYAPVSWNSLYRYLQKRGIPEEIIKESGLMVQTDQGRLYDRFRGRIMFPIHDSQGNTIGFSGRLLDSKTDSAKYVNSPETFLYHKRKSLYGIHLAKDAIVKLKRAIIVEGEFDIISPFQAGIEGVVAIKGSAVTREQLQILKRYTNRIHLALDADTAGAEAMRRGIEEAESLDFEIGIIPIPSGKDPDEAVLKHLIEFKHAVEHPLPIYDYVLDFYQKKFSGENPFDKKNLVESVTPFILMTKNPIHRSYTIQKLAQMVQLDEYTIEQSIRRTVSQRKRERFIPQTQISKKPPLLIHRYELIQRYVLSILFQNTSPFTLENKLSKLLETSDFSIPSLQKLYSIFRKYKADHPEFAHLEFTKQLPAELQPAFNELYMYASYEDSLSEINVLKLAREIKIFSLKEQIHALNSLDPSPENGQKISTLQTQLKEMEKSTVSVYN